MTQLDRNARALMAYLIQNAPNECELFRLSQARVIAETGMTRYQLTNAYADLVSAQIIKPTSDKSYHLDWQMFDEHWSS